MRLGILLLTVMLLSAPLFAQKKKVNFNGLDMNHGLFFVPNTMKPFSGTAVEEYPGGEKKMNIPIKEGKINGTVKEWAMNGQKISEGEYTGGVNHGKETQWYASGQKKLEINYVNGEAQGVCTEWFKNGTKKSEGSFDLGLEKGEHFWWYNNGAKDQLISYQSGKANGIVKHWHRAGQLKLQSEYEDGLQHGPTTEWHTNGQKILEGNYEAGKENGIFFQWSKTGLLLGKQSFNHGDLTEDLNYRNGHVNVPGGYVQVYNTANSFFKVTVIGEKVIPVLSTEVIYVVDQKYLQLFNYSIDSYFDADLSVSDETVILEQFVAKEKNYIQQKTEADIEVKQEMMQTSGGQKYLYWHFNSPSNQEEKTTDRTVLEEHYITMICNQEILNLYSLVTKKDKPAENLRLLKEVAENVIIEKNRIDLNSIARNANQ